MAQRVDQRVPTSVNLDCYNKALKLSDHVMSVCKPKDKNVNTHHIPKKNLGLGRQLMDVVVEMGADILEANEIYVGANIGKEAQLEARKERLKLQDHAKRLTYRAEHIFRILHFDRSFADSTSGYMMDLLMETRAMITKWRESELREMKKLETAIS